MDMDLIDIRPVDPGKELQRAASKMRDIAHKETNYNVFHITLKGVVATGKLHRRLTHRIKLPGRETALTFTYAVDDLPDASGVNFGEHHLDEMSQKELELFERGLPRRRVRHLTIQLSVPGAITQGLLNLEKEGFLQFFTPMVGCFFPMHDHLEANMIAHPVVPIKDVRARRGDDVVTARTPISAHFIVDINNMAALGTGSEDVE